MEDLLFTAKHTEAVNYIKYVYYMNELLTITFASHFVLL